jgi:predicted metal-dependent enzyme (double-stranded beta helix superfamily)
VKLDLETFIEECRAAKERDAVEGVVRRAMEHKNELLASIGAPTEQDTRTVFRSPELTVQWISWAPGVPTPAHEHHMWAVIGVLTGGEDHALHRARGGDLEALGGRSLREGDVLVLDDDVSHGVTNPFDAFSVALHVYGGDILGTPRRMWHPMTMAAMPMSEEMQTRWTAEFNARQRRETSPFAAANVPRIMAEMMREMTTRA